MKALCISDFTIGNSINNISFTKGEWYDYHIEIHPETKTKLYYINDLPMLERTFRANFHDLQQRREDKLNQLLND
jgi:hypothetical protein